MYLHYTIYDILRGVEINQKLNGFAHEKNLIGVFPFKESVM